MPSPMDGEIVSSYTYTFIFLSNVYVFSFCEILNMRCYVTIFWNTGNKKPLPLAESGFEEIE